MRLMVLAAVLVLAACGERAEGNPTATPPFVRPVQVASSTGEQPVPAWVNGEAEHDGCIWSSGSSEGADASYEAATLSARAELGRIRSVHIRSLNESVSVEITRGVSSAAASRFGDAVHAYSNSVLTGTEVVRRDTQRLADGGLRLWVQVRIPVDVLLPERQLGKLMEQPSGPARRAALDEEAIRCLAGDTYRRQLSIAAARLAVADDGRAPEMIVLARCLHETGQDDDALAMLNGMDALMEGQSQAVFDRYEALYVQLMATAQTARKLADHLQGLSRALILGKPIRPSVHSIPGGYEASFNVPGDPKRLIGLWVDEEDLAQIALPGAERPVSGSYTARFVWDGQPVPPRGRIVVIALPSNHPALPAAAKLAGLSLVRQNDKAAIATWNVFFNSLGLQPYESGFVIDLAPQP